MNIKCIQDYWPETKGILGIGAKHREKINGLTKGQIYNATPVSITEGEGNIAFGTIGTTVKFLIFNDDGEWQTYQLGLFQPKGFA